MVAFLCHMVVAMHLGAEKGNSIEGTWCMIAGEAEGVAIPKELFEGSRYIIKGTKMVLEADRNIRAEFLFVADFRTNPMKIDIKGKDGKVALGVFRLEKEKLILCLSEPDGNRPDAFATSQGSGRALITLAREGSAAEKSKKSP